MLIVLANQFVGDKLSTGGDLVAMQVAKRHQGDKIIIAPRIIESAVSEFFGDEIKFISSDENVRAGSASTIGGGIFTISRYWIRSWRTFFWLMKNYSDNDLIYLSGDFFCNSLPVWLLLIFRNKVRVWSNFYHRNPPPNERKGNKWIVSWGSRTLQTISLLMIKMFSEKVFVLSDIGKKELIKFGFDLKKIVISGAGIDQKWLDNFKNVKKISGRLIYVGRINVTKGAFDLIEILSLVKNTRFELIMVGMGSKEDLKKINELIDANKLKKNVKVLGFVDDDEKYRLIASSEILLLPSKEEGFGIVILEALAMKTRVICFGLPALKAIFGDKSWVNFVPVGNFKEFANKIGQTLNSKEKVNLQEEVVTWDDVYRLQFEF